ncbi:hypothetical protein CI15_26610 [Paraburkholderia monticola]|uniref:Uncharacterized protein n=1 Tax=Paraburkholderia monticola TaxID=1399968 RepID=A0A149PG75_9BURK|nr:hypothetical protein CI15_26610 [Paraburkholderia monticola]
MVTELTPAQAPPATSRLQVHGIQHLGQVTNREFETLHRGLVRQAIFPFDVSIIRNLKSVSPH